MLNGTIEGAASLPTGADGRIGSTLNSGANRGDWLYAGACRFFGGWGKAVEAAAGTFARDLLLS